MRKTSSIVGLALLLGGGIWWLQGAPMQAPSTPPAIASAAATPRIITVGTSTQVIFTVSIPDPTLNPASVNLLRLDPNGSSTVLVQMVDNGQNGDQQPGDKVFTAKQTLNEPQATEVKFQVSAAFRGVLKRSLSPLVSVGVWSRIEDPQLGYRIDYPPQYYVSQPTPAKVLFGDQPNEDVEGDQQGIVKLFISPRPLAVELSFLKTSIVGNYSETSVSIDGFSGLAVTGLFGPDVFGWGNQTYTVVLLSHHSRTFMFSYDPTRSDAVILFQQLLSRIVLT